MLKQLGQVELTYRRLFVRVIAAPASAGAEWLFRKLNPHKGSVPARGIAGGCKDRMKPPILLIEDNEQNRYLVAYLLEARGWRVVHAGEGQS